MRYVAFLRNVALGQPRGRFSLSKADLLGAFQSAGATFAESFLASGNLVFDAEPQRLPEVVAGAKRHLAGGGFLEPVCVRSLARLRELAGLEPFAAAPADDIYERCVTFLPAELEPPPPLPLVSPRRDVEVFRVEGPDVFSVTRRVGGRAGYATALLEKLYPVQATTRNWSTVLRLLRRYAD